MFILKNYLLLLKSVVNITLIFYNIFFSIDKFTISINYELVIHL